MFIEQEAITQALQLVYAEKTPFKHISTSFSNTIITDSSTGTGLSFIECHNHNNEIEFFMVNVYITYAQELKTRQTVTPIQIKQFTMYANQIDSMKLDLIKSPYSHSEYLLSVKILKKSKQKVSLICWVFHSIEQLMDGEPLIMAVHYFYEGKVVRVAWLPPLASEFCSPPAYVVVSTSEIKYYQQENNSYQVNPLFTYELFSDIDSEIVDSAFLSVHRPFFQNVILLLEKKGSILMGIPTMPRLQNNAMSFKVFDQSYNNYNSEEQSEEFKILQKMWQHIKENRTYMGIRILDISEKLTGLSIMALMSFKAQGNNYDYHVELYFLSLAKNHFQLTPIADINIPISKMSGEFVFTHPSSEQLFLRFKKSIWKLDLAQLINLYKCEEQPSKESIEKSIKLTLLVNFQEQKGSFRFMTLAGDHLCILRQGGDQVLFGKHQIVPPLSDNSEENARLLKLKVRTDLLAQMDESIQTIMSTNIAMDIKQLESCSEKDLIKYEQYISAIINRLQAVIVQEHTDLQKVYASTKKVAEEFNQKLGPKMQKLKQLQHRVNRNQQIITQVAKEKQEQIECIHFEDDEQCQELAAKLKHIQNHSIGLKEENQLEFLSAILDQRQNAQDLLQQLTELTLKIDKLIKRQARPSSHSCNL